jgi:hypothetical protein
MHVSINVALRSQDLVQVVPASPCIGMRQRCASLLWPERLCVVSLEGKCKLLLVKIAQRRLIEAETLPPLPVQLTWMSAPSLYFSLAYSGLILKVWALSSHLTTAWLLCRNPSTVPLDPSR